MEEQDFYQVLQVDPQASPEIIAEAYWLLTRKAQVERSTHNPTAGEALNRLNSAYATLVKPGMRRVYDSTLPPHRLDGSSGDGAAHRSLPGRRRDATGNGTKDLYRVLQVDPEAGREIIAAAYACLRQRYREGLWSGEDNEQALEDMAYAFSVLSDNDQRARYDQTRPIQPSGERKPGEQQAPLAASGTEAPSNGPPAASAAFRRLAGLIWLAAVTSARVARYCAVRLYRGGRWLLITVVIPGARKSLKAVKATRAVRDGSPVSQDSGIPGIDRSVGSRLSTLGRTVAGMAPLAVREQGEAEPGTPLGRLVVSFGPCAGAEFIVTDRPLSIGSDPACDVILEPQGHEVEPVHARIWHRQERFMIHRLSEQGELLVAGRPLVWAVLENGDELSIGPHRITFEIGTSQGRHGDGARQQSHEEETPTRHLGE